MDDAERQRLEFHLRQFVDAMSPTLLLASNPVALRRAMETGGASLADGARNLMEDLQAGRLSMVDATAFAPGRNLALTPGKVVHRNKLIELIQYNPQTEHRAPDAAADLAALDQQILHPGHAAEEQPGRFLVEQGFTVFMVSWKNPDASMEDTTIEDYMRSRPAGGRATWCARSPAARRVNAMGYCIGGTLLAMALAWLAAKRRQARSTPRPSWSRCRISPASATPRCSSASERSTSIEQQMMQRGYLDSREMANMFNLLRSNDLIWANVVNNYLLGQKPPAFDLLYWNSDGTRMARAAHGWYLRNTYVENNLIVPGKVELKGEPLDLGKIKQDIYAVGAEKDHIVPWDAAWRITQLVGGKVRLRAGVQRPHRRDDQPAGGKGSYWVAGAGAETPPRPGGAPRRSMTAAGGPTGPPGSPSARARR